MEEKEEEKEKGTAMLAGAAGEQGADKRTEMESFHGDHQRLCGCALDVTHYFQSRVTLAFSFL